MFAKEFRRACVFPARPQSCSWLDDDARCQLHVTRMQQVSMYHLLAMCGHTYIAGRFLTICPLFSVGHRHRDSMGLNLDRLGPQNRPAAGQCFLYLSLV